MEGREPATGMGIAAAVAMAVATFKPAKQKNKEIIRLIEYNCCLQELRITEAKRGGEEGGTALVR